MASTGLLTHCNSNASPKQQSTTHYYVPSPLPSSSRSNSASKLNSRGHQYSQSLSSDLPRPLPIPPPSHSQVQATSSATRRVKAPVRRPEWSETRPTPSQVGPRRLPALDDLPTNPKSSTPSQLSLYLHPVRRDPAAPRACSPGYWCLLGRAKLPGGPPYYV